MPPVAWAAAGVWAGAVAGESAMWASGRAAVAASLAFAAVALALLAVRVRSSRWVVAGVVLGVVASLGYGAAWARAAASATAPGNGGLSGVVVNDPEPGRWGASVRVRVSDGPARGWVARVRWPEGVSAPEMGERVAVRVALRAPEPGSEYARGAARRGEVGSGRAWAAERDGASGGVVGHLLGARRWVRQRLELVQGPGGDLLCGVLLGDRRRVAGTELARDFRSLGLSHLLAVSGDHLGLACVAVGAVLAALGLGRRPRLALSLLAGAGFVVLTGVQVSAVRAATMLAAGTAPGWAGRRASPMGALGAAVCLIVLERPWCVFELGLQMSVLAVLGLALFGGLAREWVTGVVGERERIVAPLSMTLTAQSATSAVCLPVFGVLSLAAPLANVVVVPLVSMGLVAGLSATALTALLPGGPTWPLEVAALPMRAAAKAASVIATMPAAAVPVGVVAWELWTAIVVLGVLTWVRWPDPGEGRAVRAGVCAVVVTLVLAAGTGARAASVVFLDVGQGDSVLVRDSGRTMLVDAGPDGGSLMRALGRHGVRALDSLVLTHDHDDHTGGAEALSGVVPVGWIGVSGARVSEGDASHAGDSHGDTAGGEGPERVELTSGMEWRIGNVSVRVLWPEASARPDNLNDTSVVLHLSRGSFDAVLTGDAEAHSLAAIASSGRSGRVEVLKVPHHGSRNGLTDAALGLWDPVLAVICVGRGNRFGHPHPEVLAMLEAAGARVIRTDLAGDVVVRIDRDGFRVRVTRRDRRADRCGRIAEGRERALLVVREPIWREESCVRGRSEGPQAGIPDMGQGGLAARGGRGPPQGQARGCRRPHLQHALVRWRERRRERDTRRAEHAASDV